MSLSSKVRCLRAFGIGRGPTLISVTSISSLFLYIIYIPAADMRRNMDPQIPSGWNIDESLLKHIIEI